MKKLLSICCLPIFAVFMFGCAPESPQASPKITGIALEIAVADTDGADRRTLYTSSAEARDVPVLNLKASNTVYYFDINFLGDPAPRNGSEAADGPDSASPSLQEAFPYSVFDVVYDETQILLQEMPDINHPPYILKGVKRGATRIDVTCLPYEYDDHFRCSIFVIFE